MADEIKQWEYRVQTIGSVFGTRDENIESTLNEWAQDSSEALAVYTPSNSGKVTIVAKRVVTLSTRRARSMPS